MPITVAKMAANEASVTLSLGEDTISLVYYPNKLTAKTINQLDQGLDGLNQTLAEVIKSWDVLEEDEATMYPITPDALAVLGVPFLYQIAKAIVQDIRPNWRAPQ